MSTLDDIYAAAVAGPEPFPVRAFLQQLDLDGQYHDLAPQTRQERLFEPAPFAQLDGQQHLPTNEGDTQ